MLEKRVVIGSRKTPDGSVIETVVDTLNVGKFKVSVAFKRDDFENVEIIETQVARLDNDRVNPESRYDSDPYYSVFVIESNLPVSINLNEIDDLIEELIEVKAIAPLVNQFISSYKPPFMIGILCIRSLTPPSQTRLNSRSPKRFSLRIVTSIGTDQHSKVPSE